MATAAEIDRFKERLPSSMGIRTRRGLAPPLNWTANAGFLAAAQSVVAVPLVLRSILPTLKAQDPRQLQAAQTLGANPLRVFSTVEWPLLRRGLGVGVGFAFAISLGEFGATSFLARPLNPTLPVSIFALSSRPALDAQGAAAAASVLLALICAGAMFLGEYLSERLGEIKTHESEAKP